MLRVIAGLLACVAATVAGAAAPTTGHAPGPGSLAGLWRAGGDWQTTPTQTTTLASGRTPERSRVLKPVDAQWPPLQPWASELLEQRIRKSQEGDPYVSTLVQCLPSVPALMLGGPYPMQILESPGQVTMLLEEQNHFRIVYLGGKHPEDPDPTYMGHSIGRWEGDTLVVDTVGFVESTPIDRMGLPHSDALHVIERFRRIGPDTLQLLVTIDDPKAFTRRWDARVVYHKVPAGVQMIEYICENNRELSDAAQDAPDGKSGK